ncbi:MAG: leucine-rich repeat protein [Oscillospiraceae bacterium]
MKKRLLSFVLAALMIASLLPATALAADIVDSGTCGAEGDGSNLTWTLDSEGVLTISGSGDMHGYDHLGAPWYGIRSPVKSAVIADGVTSIGDSAFFDCTSLTSVTIPDSVTSIGEYAFYNCTSLTSVTIPNSVTSIGEYTFYNCTSLTSVAIPDSVTSIGEYAFSHCTSLTSVTIPDSVTSIGRYAFYYCTSLTSVTIPDSVTSIGEYAFYDCTSLTSVTIPDSVTSIGDGAFSYCESLTSVTIPDSVTSIGWHAFDGCTSLTGIWVAEGNSHYASDASGVLFNKDKTTLVQCPGAFAAYTIPNSVTSIGADAFSYCRSLTSVTIPDSVTSIGESSFYKCTSLTSVTIPDSVTSIGYKAFGSCESLTSVTIPDSVTSIGDGAFSCCTSLTSVTIPNSVTSIGDSAFYDCTSLTSVTIPNSVTIIGVAAFSCCTSLTSVTIPDSVTIIGGSAFFDCDNLTDVYYTGTEIAWNKIKISDYSDVLKNATIHYFSEWTREKEPTCTEPGSETSVCPEAGCGKTFTREIPALGHSWDEGKVTKPATEAEDGVKTFTCTRCGETKTETIPATGSDVDVTEMFSDVTKNWAYPGIQYCVTHKLMGSTGGDKFAPTMTTTRAQIVQILYNLEGEPKVSGTTPFTDLTQDWYQDAVLWAYQTGVVAGTGDGTTFDPDLPVTREQIAVILMEYTDRILNIKRTWTPADLSTFPDADSVSDWAKDAMADAVALGLISGASNGGQTLLEPQGSATREQVATILMEFCKNVKK